MWKKPTHYATREIQREGDLFRIRQGMGGKWVEFNLSEITGCDAQGATVLQLYRAGQPAEKLRMHGASRDAESAFQLLGYTLQQQGAQMTFGGKPSTRPLPGVWVPISDGESYEYCRSMKKVLTERLAVYSAKYADKGITLKGWVSMGTQQTSQKGVLSSRLSNKKPAMASQFVVAALKDGFLARHADPKQKQLMVWSDSIVETTAAGVQAMINGEDLLEQQGTRSFSRLWKVLDEFELEPSSSTVEQMEQQLTEAKPGWRAWIV